jgi:hypothetical protein
MFISDFKEFETSSRYILMFKFFIADGKFVMISFIRLCIALNDSIASMVGCRF